MRKFVILGSSSITTPPPNPSSTPHHHSLKPLKPSLPRSPLRSTSTSTSTATPLPRSLRPSSLLTYYAGLASQFAHNGRLHDFASVAESVASSGIDPSHFVAALNATSVAKGFSENLSKGDLCQVVEILKKVEKVGVSTVKLFDGVAFDLLKKESVLLINNGKVKEFVLLMETLNEFSFSIKELVDPNHVIKVCLHKCEPQMAMRFAFILPQERILLCDIINGFGKKKDLDSALKAYEVYKHNMAVPNMYVYRSIIDVCGACGNHMKSRCIYEDMLSQNITPNIYVFNSLMNVNAHDLGYTLHLYKSMQNLGVTADMASYNILLKACCLAERVDIAQDIYREVKHLQSKGHLKLDAFTYCTIVKAFSDAKLWKMALRVKRDMLSFGVTPNMFTWSSLISACANAGLVEKAIQLLEEMLLAGCEPNAQCFNIILHAFVEAHQYDRAFRLFQFWKGSKVQGALGKDYDGNKSNILSSEHENQQFVPSTPNPLSNLHHVNFIENIPFEPSVTTYNILMKACGSDYYRAKSLMDEMKTIGLYPDQISWTILIDIYGDSHNMDGAIQTLKNMHAAGVEPDVVAYTTVIKVCVESKDLMMAFSLFEEMKSYQIKPNLVTYNTLLRARSRYGSVKEVLQCLSIYQDMRKAGYKSNDCYLKQLVEEWCEGVIRDEHEIQKQHVSYKRRYFKPSHGLLLDKVAAHLQNTVSESIAIDLQGLTKVEARLVVLAVLQMIKEKYTSGISLKDDMWITLGLNKLDVPPELNVKDAIQKLLQNELGLEVLDMAPRFTEGTGSNRKSASSARRPEILERLKVTKNSLNDWLQRRVGDIRM